MHEITLLYPITLIELLIHIEREQRSIRVLTPEKKLQKINLQIR